MHSSLSFVALAVALSGVVAFPFPESFGKFDLSSDNCFNAPTPPWEAGCHPGWYFGNGHPKSDQYPCLEDVSKTMLVPNDLTTERLIYTPFFFFFDFRNFAATWTITRISSTALPGTPNHHLDTTRLSVVSLALLRLVTT